MKKEKLEKLKAEARRAGKKTEIAYCGKCLNTDCRFGCAGKIQFVLCDDLYIPEENKCLK